MPASHCHAPIGIDMSFTDQLKAALAKKHAAQHPDSKSVETVEKARSGRAPAAANKPQRKASGRGR